MKLSRTVSYAVRATLQLAQSDPATPVPCSRLASQGEMPERFLLQILRILVTHGILRSTRGVDGGYSLTKPADQISLLEVIEAIDGPLDSESRNWSTSTYPSTEGKLQDALKEVTNTARRQLESIKLSQLLPPPDVPLPESELLVVPTEDLESTDDTEPPLANAAPGSVEPVAAGEPSVPNETNEAGRSPDRTP